MKVMIKIFSIGLITLAFASCDNWDQKLTLINGKLDTIFVAIPLDESFKEHPIRLDSNGDTLWTHIRYISPGDSIQPLSIEGMSWEETINRKCKDSTLFLFFFEKELLKTTPRDSLVSNQVYSKKYSYKVKELQKANWRIEYKQ